MIGTRIPGVAGGVHGRAAIACLLVLSACSRNEVAGVYTLDPESIKKAAKVQADAMQFALRGSKIKDAEKKVEQSLAKDRAELVLKSDGTFSRMILDSGNRKQCSGTYRVEGANLVLEIAEQGGDKVQPPRVERLEMRDGGVVMKEDVPFEMRLVRK